MANINFDAAVKNYMNGMEAGAAVKAASYDAVGYGFDAGQVVFGAIETVARAGRHACMKGSDYCHGVAAEKRGEEFKPRRFFSGLDNPDAESDSKNSQKSSSSTTTNTNTQNTWCDGIYGDGEWTDGGIWR